MNIYILCWGCIILDKTFTSKKMKAAPRLKNIISENRELRIKCRKMQEDNEKLRRISEIDPLTRVYQRAAAIEHIENMLRGGTNGSALIVLDLDNFKHMNDTYGHSYGDAVITTLAECITKSISPESIPGRFGGDEFFVFIPDATEQSALETAQAIIETFAGFSGGDASLNRLSCSAGVAFGEGNISYSRLFQMADKALYSVKHNGKGHARLYNHNDMRSINSPYITYFDQSELNTNPHSRFVSQAIEIASKSKTTDDAVNSLLSNICLHFNIMNIKILSTDLKQDMVTVVYNLKDRNKLEKRKKNNVGYYFHSDLVMLRDFMPDRTLMRMPQEQLSVFSPKLRRELLNLPGSHRLFYMNKTDDGNYTTCFFELEGESRFMDEDEKSSISDLTAIVLAYADRARHVSKNEKLLKEALEVDKITQVYTMHKFYIQSGLIRKISAEGGDYSYLISTKFNNLREFNRAVSYDDGDELLKDFGQRFEKSQYKERGIIARDNATFYTFVRSKRDMEAVEKVAVEAARRFIEEYKKKYPGFVLDISVGTVVVKEEESLAAKLDDVYYNGKKV